MHILDTKRLAKTTINLGNQPCQWQIITKKPHACAMHAKTSKEIIHAIRYLQEKPAITIVLTVLLWFPTFPSPSCSKNPSMPHSPRVLQENSNYPRVWERERERKSGSTTTTRFSCRYWVACMCSSLVLACMAYACGFLVSKCKESKNYPFIPLWLDH